MCLNQRWRNEALLSTTLSTLFSISALPLSHSSSWLSLSIELRWWGGKGKPGWRELLCLYGCTLIPDSVMGEGILLLLWVLCAHCRGQQQCCPRASKSYIFILCLKYQESKKKKTQKTKTKALEPQMCKNHKAASFCHRLFSWQCHSPLAVKCMGEAVESSGKWREIWFTKYLAALSLENWVGERAGFGAGIPHSLLCFACSFFTSDLV